MDSCKCKIGEPHHCEPSAVIGVPRSEVEEMASVVEEMAREMRMELLANVRKGNRQVWKAMPPMQLLMEVYYHAGKLQQAIVCEDKQKIREYAADVANMAMMVADAFGIFQTPGALLRGEKAEPKNQEWSKGVVDRYSKWMRY